MISANAYQQIVCSLDKAFADASLALNEIIRMLGVLNNMLITEIDNDSISDPILVLEQKLDSYSRATAFDNRFLVSIHKHIVKNYGSVTQFIIDNDIAVPERVASVIAVLGWTIPEENIGVCPYVPL